MLASQLLILNLQEGITQMSYFIISIDSGTTSTRAVLFNEAGEVVAIEQKEFNQIFPKYGCSSLEKFLTLQ